MHLFVRCCHRTLPWCINHGSTALCLPASAARCQHRLTPGTTHLPLPLHTDHVREAFPGWELEFRNGSRSEALERPFRITFPPLKEEEAEGAKGKRKAGEAADGEAAGAAAAPRKLVVESYTPRDPGPYPEDLPPQNRVRFTPVQTQAIMSGVQPGLTMVVGPPGALVVRGGVLRRR